MKKINASSEKLEEGFLPAETLWKAALIVRRKATGHLQLKAEPKPHELLGLTIGMVRRRKDLSLEELAEKTGFSVEELLAFEAGLLPVGEFIKYLPAILREVKIPRKSIQPLLRKIAAT